MKKSSEKIWQSIFKKWQTSDKNEKKWQISVKKSQTSGKSCKLV